MYRPKKQRMFGPNLDHICSYVFVRLSELTLSLGLNDFWPVVLMSGVIKSFERLVLGNLNDVADSLLGSCNLPAK